MTPDVQALCRAARHRSIDTPSVILAFVAGVLLAMAEESGEVSGSRLGWCARPACGSIP